ncbi:hypothetical protein [Ornithinimicrobium cryptoxanthini]|uniref:Uncharacterized protein n=1 Tax=Ornithinimicrobium cryptoxanthini TaxID=2934161 RepID=A0ABY4YGQ4_9MICO|nr:hypothetical protein [Ornithinimicrobium cryptoxanthini]USQ75946.1 hypothetical protein NF557_15315 [Ornithinimicrobium cryptoxanthini]
MGTEPAPDGRSDLVRAFDGWPKAVRVVIFALAVSFALVMLISYVARESMGMAIVWAVVALVWSMIGVVRLGEADRYARRARQAGGSQG